MAREEQLLSASIRKTFDDAQDTEKQLSGVMMSLAYGKPEALDDPNNSEVELRSDHEKTLRFYLTNLYRDVAILAERLGVPIFAKNVRKTLKSCGDKELAAMNLLDGADEFYSVRLKEVHWLFKPLATMTDGHAVTGLEIFETILRNAPNIIRAKNLEPTKELDVTNAVFEVLQFAFHDVVRDIQIPQLVKTYRPDFGVRSLMAAAEIKFATSEQEIKTSLDGIYTDMKGYSGHPDWRTFFAVIYTTEAILNQDKLEKECRGVSAEKNWSSIIVVGPGGRKAKQGKDN
jgi:hypothetical protein